MKTVKMRIVAIATACETITIQCAYGHSDYKSSTISFDEFERTMQLFFPRHYNYYLIAKEAGEKTSCADWFYNFGETNEMRRKGESYIFSE